MRAVMQETLFLLFCGRVARALDPQEASQPVWLSYEDLAQLRPKFGSSSWRVIMNKLVARKYVFRGREAGRTAFMLTSLGESVVQQMISPAKPLLDSPFWTLVVLKNVSSKGSAFSAAGKLLSEHGFTLLSPQVGVAFTRTYSQALSQQLLKEGMVAVFVPFDHSLVQPFSLLHLLEEAGMPQRQARQLEQISESCEQLLRDLQEQNKMSHQQKQRVGSVAVSGLSLFSLWNPLEQEGKQAFAQRLVCARMIDELMVVFCARNHA